MKGSIFQEEKNLRKKGFKVVVGLDEAGRGPLAGPVLAAAVFCKNRSLKTKRFFKDIRDSKKLLPKQRENFYNLLTSHYFIEWGIGRVSEKVIDKINIFEASKLAMIKALKDLEKKMSRKAECLILDGNFMINWKIPQKPIIKGDEKVFSCMAAGIIAKVTRDRIMDKYHKKYPCYRFDKNKGYPTPYHFKSIKKNGISKIHRKSFALLKKNNPFVKMGT